MLPAPYLIVAFHVPPDTPNCDAIVQEIENEMPVRRPPPFSLGVPDTYALKTTDNMKHRDHDELTDFFLAKNVKYGGVIRWFAQICGEAWISME